MRAIRAIMIFFIWVSLLLVPYSFIEYFCYLGLCGGGAAREIKATYVSFFGYFGVIYLFVALTSLYLAHVFHKKQNDKASIIWLFIPVIFLIPYGYVELKTMQITSRYDEMRRQYTSAQANDYVCAPGKFIRFEGGNTYYFFNFASADSGTINGYDSFDELKQALQQQNIDLTRCKNQKGETLP